MLLKEREVELADYSEFLFEFGMLREAYLASLKQPQDLFVEKIVRKSKKKLFRIDNEFVGYCIVSQDNWLVEYFITDGVRDRAGKIFKQLLEQLSISSAYVKSFDHFLLLHCVKECKTQEVAAILYREIDTTDNLQYCEYKVETAQLSNAYDIASINDAAFLSPNEIEEYIRENKILLFYLGGELIGCATCQPVIIGRNDYDVGLLVSPNKRRNGHGTNILSYLIKLCVQQGHKPVASCKINNFAARKTLERVGFIGKHSLIKFTF